MLPSFGFQADLQRFASSSHDGGRACPISVHVKDASSLDTTSTDTAEA